MSFLDLCVSKDMMEHRFGRDSVLDGITSLRNLMSKLAACFFYLCGIDPSKISEV